MCSERRRCFGVGPGSSRKLKQGRVQSHLFVAARVSGFFLPNSSSADNRRCFRLMRTSATILNWNPIEVPSALVAVTGRRSRSLGDGLIRGPKPRNPSRAAHVSIVPDRGCGLSRINDCYSRPGPWQLQRRYGFAVKCKARWIHTVKMAASLWSSLENMATASSWRDEICTLRFNGNCIGCSRFFYREIVNLTLNKFQTQFASFA